MTSRKGNEDDEEFNGLVGDIGIFLFAKKTAMLVVPMGIVASIFGLWLRSELLAVRQDFATTIASEMRTVRLEMVSRKEFDTLKALIDERHERQIHADSDQLRQIQKNTIYLERIGQKLGIARPPD